MVFMMTLVSLMVNPFAAAYDHYQDESGDEDFPTLERISPERSTKIEKILDQYKRTGERKSCLPLRSISQIKALDDRHFLVTTSSNRKYINVVSKGCNGAARAFNRLQYSTTSAQLCRNEIISVVDNLTGFSLGSCGVGIFFELKER